MTNAGFFRGTSADQDFRFSNKQNKSRKEFRFPTIDTTKIDIESLKPWILDRIKIVLQNEDELMSDAILEFFYEKQVDGSAVSEFIVGFADVEKTSQFMQELWSKFSQIKQDNNNLTNNINNNDNKISQQPSTSSQGDDQSLSNQEALALLEPFIKKIRSESKPLENPNDRSISERKTRWGRPKELSPSIDRSLDRRNSDRESDRSSSDRDRLHYQRERRHRHHDHYDNDHSHRHRHSRRDRDSDRHRSRSRSLSRTRSHSHSRSRSPSHSHIRVRAGSRSRSRSGTDSEVDRRERRHHRRHHHKHHKHHKDHHKDKSKRKHKKHKHSRD